MSMAGYVKVDGRWMPRGTNENDVSKHETKPSERSLSLPASVAAVGIKAWNSRPELAVLRRSMEGAVKGRCTVEDVLEDVTGLLGLEHNLMVYMYLRALADENLDLYYGLLLTAPALLLPVAYTPTVGEVCQKFGMMPFYLRGCYVSISHRGRVKEVLEEYAKEMLNVGSDGSYLCDCIVFSDGGRILGLGDLGAWGMGIPLGKLDLYTVCGGFNPSRTIPVIIDAGISGPEGNSAGLQIRGHSCYTGLKTDRVKHKTAEGVLVNSAYYGSDSFIDEFMTAARDLFGKTCLLQFEDFNSNDAFPLLAEYRNQFLTYNDDIQGTAAVAVAAVMGAVKIMKPSATDLMSELRSMTFLLHGAGSANLGSANLLIEEAGVPPSSVVCTNSKGIIWKSEDGSTGSYRNNDQKAVAKVGEPDFDSTNLVEVVKRLKPDVLVGAVGVAPGCFTKEVVEAMVSVQEEKKSGGRPIIFALSNPKTQAEITAEDCYKYSHGKAIFGSGTRYAEVVVNGKKLEPGQVNNFFIFPGMSFGAVACQASSIPERFFMVAAEAVANSLDEQDILAESVVPFPGRIREVAHTVATAVVLAAQSSGLAGKKLGNDSTEVASALKALMWEPRVSHRQFPTIGKRKSVDFGGGSDGYQR